MAGVQISTFVDDKYPASQFQINKLFQQEKIVGQLIESYLQEFAENKC